MRQKRWIAVLLSIAIIVSVVAAPPVVLGTKTYPITVVNGNSMVPTIQNGDLVVFRSVDPNRPIPLGTVIVFVPSNFGLSSVDYLVRPSVVHRVVGIFRQFDGVLYYTTKGDNNQQNDTTLVRASNVLGVPVTVIPRAGLVLSFVASPQGLVAVVGATAFVYLERSTQKSEIEARRKKFLGKLARMVLQGGLSEEAFEKFELAINYASDLDSQVQDERIAPLVDWLKKGGLKKNYSVETEPCPKCSEEAMAFRGAENKLVVCGKCISNTAHKAPGSFDQKVAPGISSDEGLDKLEVPAVTLGIAAPGGKLVRKTQGRRVWTLGKSASMLVYLQLIVIILLIAALSTEYSFNAFMQLWFSENASPLGYLLAGYLGAILAAIAAVAALLVQKRYWHRNAAKA